MEQLAEKVETSANASEDSDSLNDKLTKVQEQYDNLAERIKERNGKISNVVALSKKVTVDGGHLNNALTETERDLAKLDTKSFEEQDILEDVTQAKVWENFLPVIHYLEIPVSLHVIN